MIVYPDGRTLGTVGGGAIESTVIERARRLAASREPVLLTFDLEDDTGMITVAWPGQPWLDRKLREGDVLLVSGKVKFFHGRQLQPREYTVLERASAPGGVGSGGPIGGGAGMIFVSYPASEEAVAGVASP